MYILCFMLLAAVGFGQGAESLIPALAYGPGCSSAIHLRNVSDRPVTVVVEGHRASGALVGLEGRESTTLRLAAGGRDEVKLDISEETVGAWVRVRERGTAGSPSIAVSAVSECVVGNELHTATRDVAYPMRNPWFDSDVTGLKEGLISMINASPESVKVSVCYWSGSRYAMPQAEWKPICSMAFDVQVPPFGSREYPVSRGGSSRLQVKAAGERVVLEVLRPLKESVRVYSVDSSIRFGEGLP